MKARPFEERVGGCTLSRWNLTYSRAEAQTSDIAARASTFATAGDTFMRPEGAGPGARALDSTQTRSLAGAPKRG